MVMTTRRTIFGCTSIVVLLVFQTVLTGQSRPATGSITGTVLCDDMHGPARRASVYLQSVTAYRPGSFSLPGEVYGSTTEMDGVKIVQGGQATITIQLKRGASITGSVTYSDNTPVPNLALTPKLKLANGEFADMGVGASHTDSAGHYRIDGLPDGAYVLLGGIEGPMVPVFGGDKLGGSGLIVFSGNGMRPSKARVVSVKAPNEYAGVDIAIPLVGVHEVSGRVTGTDGHRLNHGTVRLYPTGEPRFSLSTPVQADGTFRFNRIPQDAYTVLLEDSAVQNRTRL
jgi:hypothetical protein